MQPIQAHARQLGEHTVRSVQPGKEVTDQVMTLQSRLAFPWIVGAGVEYGGRHEHLADHSAMFAPVVLAA